MVDTSYLRSLVAAAMPLQDRFAGQVKAMGGSDVTSQMRRLGTWREIISAGSERDLLPARLANDGLDLKSCLPALGDVELEAQAALPSWASLLRNVLESEIIPNESAFLPPGLVDPARPIPFEEIFLPWLIEVGGKAFTRGLDSDDDLISRRAKGDLCRPLLQALSAQSELALSAEFHTYRALRRPSCLLSPELEPTRGTAPSRKLYLSFVEQCRAGGFKRFLTSYPVLGRLLGTLLGQWIDNTREFRRRLVTDLADISETLGRGQHPGLVETISCGLSDRHRAGKAVMILTFASGLKVVYKPKNLDMDLAWFHWLSWLAEKGLEEPLRVLKVIAGDGYGWTEYVRHQPCDSHQEVEAYYRRAGTLLCLVDVLGGNDCHHENLIADGDQPVLVDTETLMHPRRQADTGEHTATAFQLAESFMQQSVLRTGLLPSWIRGEGGRSYDVSGLGASGRQVTGFKFNDWKDINTDQMGLIERVGERQLNSNTPSFDGHTKTAQGYVSQILEGLERTYRLLIEYRQEILAPKGPLSLFRHQPVRFLARGTKSYRAMLSRLRHPEMLENGADRSIEMERLLTGAVQENSEPTPPSWPLHACERQALEQLDIPSFHGTTDRRSLYADELEVVPHYFESASFNRVMARFEGLDESDLRRQSSYCRAALEIRFNGRHFEQASTQRPESLSRDERGDSRELTSEELIMAAKQIGEDLCHRAIYGEDQTASWISVRFDTETGRQGLGPLGPGLYDGACGVAIFLTALAAVTRQTKYAELARAALRPLCRSLESSSSPHRLPVSGTCGIGGMIYGLTFCGRTLGDTDLLDSARTLAATITAERIAEDNIYDVIGGAAGAALGLLALDGGEHTAALRTAISCADHLLEQRSAGPETGGHRVWHHPRATQPLTGFAHGAAGIAYSLLKIFTVTGKSEYRLAALEAISYEASVYQEDARNWPDFRHGRRDSPLGMTAWCAGATGIGLSRLRCLDLVADSDFQLDVERAIQATLREIGSGTDHLCCGRMGRVAFLHEAGMRLEREDLIDVARSNAAAILKGAQRRGGLSLWAATSDAVFCPSFFQGTSGVGYELLRLARPNQLPSVLLWD